MRSKKLYQGGEVDVDEARHLCIEVPLMMDRMHRAGLHRTAKKMHEVVQSIGWEVANHNILALAKDTP